LRAAEGQQQAAQAQLRRRHGRRKVARERGQRRQVQVSGDGLDAQQQRKQDDRKAWVQGG